MRSRLARTFFGAVLSFQVISSYGQTPATDAPDMKVIDKIKKEGLENSQIMDTISYLTDVHGPRLTGSPITKRAAQWTLAKVKEWGLENEHTEPWGPFGRGWTLQSCSVNMVEPTYAPLIAHVKAWSPSTTKTIQGVPIYLDVQKPEDLEKYRGKLGRAIVLIAPPREIKALFDAPAIRKKPEDLLKLANAMPPSFGGGAFGDRFRRSLPQGETPNPATQPPAPTGGDQPATPAPSPATTAAQPPNGGGPASADPRALMRLTADKWQLAYSEGAAVVLEPGRGDGGNVFVASVTMPRNSSDQGAAGNPFSRGPRPWSADAGEILPQAVLAAEHYNRLVRLVQKGVAPKVEVDIACQYHADDLNSFNIIAEIPGSDLKDEIVMLGGHFDSWQSGTGATDNAVGCGVALEAIRILKAIDAKPRRTIRVALWTGEEQGLLGSRAYVEEHFGKAISESRPPVEGGPRSEGGLGGDGRGESSGRRRPTYQIKPEQEKVSAYYNLDNGTGKIRGIYLQGNEAVRPIFRQWLQPFQDMEATTLSISNTGGTDHLSFDSIGIPGFQFIQDEVEYDTRTHHSSMDVYERIQADDVKQASIVMASFVYHTAMRDEKLPRKALNGSIAKPTEDAKPAEPAAASGGSGGQ
jgi:carboxypeptidase Q